MKKEVFLCFVMAALFLTGCGSSRKDAAPAEAAATQIDIDLTKLSSTMVYSEVYNMLTEPDQYIGKTVKVSGQFAVYQDQEKGKNYYACLIADATACCQQGMEFVWNGDHTYPDDYPQLGEEVTVVGVFDTYIEDDYQFCQLISDSVTFS